MKFLKYIIILSGLLNLASCESYLEQVNPNALSSEAIGSSEQDLLLLAYGCYNALQKGMIDGYQYLDSFSDVAYGSSDGINTITEGGGTTEGNIFRTYWERQYSVIARCNEFLATFKTIESPTDNMLTIEGEVKFLRAMAYYYLTALYKDAPLIVDRQSFDNRFVSKNSQSEIKALILSDLNDAISNLPVDQVYPRATKGAALALKARVHAFFSEWNEVLTLTQDILDLNKYDLYPDYIKLFTLEAEGNVESIFSVAFETGIGLGESFSCSYPLQPFLTSLRPISNYADAFYCTDGLSISESPLYKAETFYENRDPRFDRSILRKGVIWTNGAPYNPSLSSTGYGIRKYVRSILLRGDGPLDFMVIRFADILLLRAEALVETNDVGEEVYQLVNRVRSRVGMPLIEEVEGSALTQTEMRDLIRHERLVELGLEGGIRWLDIKRWNIVEEVYNSITFHNRPYLGERTLYWPIPQVEIDNNPSLQQHDFWN